MKKALATCKTNGRVYNINGKDVFLYSGEMHYFRIPRRYWERHLDALVDAGCNGVSTYVPWSWHEFKEGTTDLTGKTHPERDLKGFLDLAAKKNLFVTVKPGPYIMAEATDQGIPRWLTDNYPETKSIDVDGTEWGADFICFASPTLRAKATKWLKLFATKLVVPRQHLKQGAVIQMQLCNEIGMFQWLGSRGDYSEGNVQGWYRYLKAEFKTPQALGELLDREVKSFEEVVPPHEFCDSRREYVLYRLWHDYHRWMYADYVSWMQDTLRDAGVTVPFFTNVGGWVYGRAHEFPLNGSFHRRSAEINKDVFYGIDHIPEFVSALNSHDGIVSTQVCDEIQRNKQPLYSAELQCGSREHGVQPYPNELGLFYRQCLIHGLTGMNFYMFAQGKNPKGRGIDGPMFYWFNAVNYKGQRQEVYPTIQELGEWLGVNGDQLIHSNKPADLALAHYPYLYETEFLYPKLQKKEKVDLKKLGIMDPVNLRDKAFFDGVIRILVKENVPYDLTDITIRSVKNLQKYRELVVLPNELMDPKTQQKLADYVTSGGKLIIFPTVPKYDLQFGPCRILEDTLGIHVTGTSKSNRIYMEKLKDIPVPQPPSILSGKGTKVLAKTANGEIVGVEKKVGKGSVRYFGFMLNYTIEEHPDLWSAMMEFPQIARNARADNDDIQIEARITGKEGLLFVGNIHRAPIKAHVWATDPASGGEIDLGVIHLDCQRGLLLPLQKPLAKGLTLAYAHAEYLGHKTSGKSTSIQLRGLATSKGTVAIKSTTPITDITVDGQSVKFTARNGITIAQYDQTGNTQTIVAS